MSSVSKKPKLPCFSFCSLWILRSFTCVLGPETKGWVSSRRASRGRAKRTLAVHYLSHLGRGSGMTKLGGVCMCTCECVLVCTAPPCACRPRGGNWRKGGQISWIARSCGFQNSSLPQRGIEIALTWRAPGLWRLLVLVWRLHAFSNCRRESVGLGRSYWPHGTAGLHPDPGENMTATQDSQWKWCQPPVKFPLGFDS